MNQIVEAQAQGCHVLTGVIYLKQNGISPNPDNLSGLEGNEYRGYDISTGYDGSTGLERTALLGVLEAPLRAFADEPAPRPEAEAPATLRALAGETRAIRTLQARLRQEKILTVLAETVRSEGTLAFARPRRLVVELGGEVGTRIVIDGDAMTTVDHALRRTARARLSSDPRARAVADHLFLLIDLDMSVMTRAYSLTVLGENPLKIQLVPKHEVLRQMIGRIELELDPRGFASSLALFETNGDVTRMRLDRAILNAPIDERVFGNGP